MNDNDQKSTFGLPHATRIPHICVPEGQVEAIDQVGIDLHNAVRQNNLLRVQSLLMSSTTDVNVVDESGETALMIAIHIRNQKTTRVPLTTNDINAVEVSIISGASEAISASQDIDIINYLSKDHRTCVNQSNQQGDTALTIAARVGDWEVIQVLLDTSEYRNQPLDLNALSSDGKTALAIAVEQQKSPVIHQLLNAKSTIGFATTQGVNMEALYRYLDTCIITVRNTDFGRQGEYQQFNQSKIGIQLINRHLHRVYHTLIHLSLAGSVLGAASYMISRSPMSQFFTLLITTFSVGALVNCFGRQGMVSSISDLQFVDQIISTSFMPKLPKRKSENDRTNQSHQNLSREQGVNATHDLPHG